MVTTYSCPTCLQTSVADMEANGAAAMCYSVPVLIDDSGAVIGVDTDQVRWARSGLGRRRMRDAEVETPLEAIWSHFRAMPSACLVRRTSFEQTQGWDPSLCRPAWPFHAEDKDMAIQLALCGPVHRLQSPTLQYRVLPTVHRHALYEGLLAVDRKWWNAPLGAEDRRRVRQAVRFDALVTMLDWAPPFARFGAPDRYGMRSRRPERRVAPSFDGRVCRFGCAGSRHLPNRSLRSDARHAPHRGRGDSAPRRGRMTLRP